MVKFAVTNSVQKKKMIFGTEGDFSQQHIKEEKKNMDRAQARKKAEALVAKMTIEERAGQLKYDAPAIERLGIPTYNWWNEALHGVARAGTATVFPQAIGCAAMFDEEEMQKIADVIAEEGRAKYNAFSKEEDRDIYKGLTFWSPNINIFRDPRWGRGHETYGEDPFLTARLGVAFIKGLQGDGETMKVAACAKHFAVHSGPEAIRHEFDAVVSQKDLYETYLPAFEAAVKEGGVEAVMGGYNRTNGEPSCGSKTLLKKILREDWGFEGHVVSDCWAIQDFHQFHKVTNGPKESAQMALEAGCDLNCGCTYAYIMAALQDGLVTEEQITEACIRVFTTRFLLGMFDGSEYDDIPYEVVECKEHRNLAVEAAHKGMVLLKNDGILPLDKRKIRTIGVVGPNANNRIALQGNYHGTSSRYVTVLEGIQKEVEDDCRVYYAEGSHMYKDTMENLAWKDDRISEAVITAKQCDVTIVVLGLDELMEGEEPDQSNRGQAGDKASLEFPGCQQRLLEAVVAVGKPVITVVLSGSAMDLRYADAHTNAILQAWYPGAEGGTAVADVLFGRVSPSGKLPVTFYKDTSDLPEFTDYSMKNRTYRYMEQEALYPFGFGLTYGNVKVSAAEFAEQPEKEKPVKIRCTVTNTGKWDTEEVVQVYIKDWKSKYAVRNHSLCGFRRVRVKAGESIETELTIDPRAFTIVDEEGKRYVDSNKFSLYVATTQPDARSTALTGHEAVELRVVFA